MTDDPSVQSERYGWYVVFVLILAYTVSYIDRTILTLMVDPIRESLQISDVEISLLHGLAFAVFYTLLGLPIGRLVDRYNRTQIITAGIIVWSAFTALCGLSRNFSHMFLARVGVGAGEAALSPGAYSLLSDYFRPGQLTRALSVYQGAIYVGAGLAMIAGGSLIAMMEPVTLPVLGYLEPWQSVFLLVSLPGLFVAILVFFLREPERRGKIATEGAKQPSIGAVGGYIRTRGAAYALLIGGYSMASLAWNGATAWIPSFFMRGFGWTPAETGLAFGMVLLLCGTSGIITGGVIASHLRSKGRMDSNLLIGVISASTATVAGVAASLMPTAGVALTLFALFAFCGAMPYGGAAAALQEITPNQMRGQISALYLFVLNLAGIGCGPTIVAWLTENVFGDPALLGRSIAVVIGVAMPVSALLLWRGCTAYRAALAKNAF